MYAGREYGPFLEKIAKSEPRIRAVLLTDLAGVLKSRVERTTATTPTPNADQLHAFLGCAIAQSVAEMGVQYALNALNTVIVDYQQGTLILAPTGQGVLIILADPGANLGLIRYQIMRVAKKLRQLEAQLETKQEISQIPSLMEIPSRLSTEPRRILESTESDSATEKQEQSNEKDALKQALAALDDL